MARRYGEFKRFIQKEVAIRAHWTCEKCGKKLERPTARNGTKRKREKDVIGEVHHKLPLHYAKQHFRHLYHHPYGDRALSSMVNAEFLCPECHKEKHHKPETVEDWEKMVNLYSEIAQTLVLIAERIRAEKQIEKPLKTLTVTRQSQ